LNVYF